MKESALRIVFMGTPEFAVPTLQALISSSPDFEVVACYTQPDRQVGRGLEVKSPPVKRVALAAKLPVFQPVKLSAPGEFERLQALRPDVIVVVAFGQILKRNFLDLPRLGCVNVHSSLLPRWRGAAPIHWALLSGDSETGVTTMKLVEELDAGDILLQDSTSIDQKDTAGSLHDRLAEMGAPLLLKTLNHLRSGDLTPTPQDPSKVLYAPKLTKDMEWLNPALPAKELERRIRALNPWPGTSLWLDNLGRVKVKAASAVDSTAVQGPALSVGVLQWMGPDLCLGTADGALKLQTLQWEGKRETDALAWANGLAGKGGELPLEVTVPASGLSTREN